MRKNFTGITLGFFWQHARRYSAFILLLVVSTAMASLQDVINPLFYKRFFDILSTAHNPSVVFPQLVTILGYILLVWIINWIAWRVAFFTNNHIQPKIISDLYNSCFLYINQHSLSFFQDNFVGSLTKQMGRFVSAFENIADILMWNVIGNSVNLIGMFVVLCLHNLWLALILFVWMIAFIAINMWLSGIKLPHDIKRSEAESEVSALFADVVGNQMNVKLFNGLEREKQRFFTKTDHAAKLRTFAWNMENWFEAAQAVLMIALEVGIMYVVAVLWKNGQATVGDFVLVQSFVLTIFLRLWGIGHTIRRWFESLSDAEEMSRILHTPHEITNRSRARGLKIVKGALEFKEVDFYYHQTRAIFEHFNLQIKAHQKVALVGPSGAGKSTIVKLLLRLNDVSSGNILIDGQDIRKITLESLRSAIGLVPQEPLLFHRSLLENIRYGKPDATTAEVIEVARLAHCDEFIQKLPERYETLVGERGVKLSGGERQRIAIARAILFNAPILVLDEATSSLDSESEKLIQEALRVLMRGKTVLVIAHRLSTIMEMDRIVVLQEGTIVEDGSHTELLRNDNGLYRHLWQLQAGGFILDEEKNA